MTILDLKYGWILCWICDEIYLRWFKFHLNMFIRSDFGCEWFQKLLQFFVNLQYILERKALINHDLFKRSHADFTHKFVCMHMLIEWDPVAFVQGKTQMHFQTRKWHTLSFWKGLRKFPPISPSSRGVPGWLLMLRLPGEFCTDRQKFDFTVQYVSQTMQIVHEN